MQPLCTQILLLLLKPFGVLYGFITFFLWSTDKNVIKHSNAVPVGRKNNAICKRMDLADIKRVAHRHNATVNDVVLALLSVSMKQYMQAMGDHVATSINTLVPFSLRALPQVAQQHRVENDFTILCFTVPLHEQLQEAIQAVNALTTPLKSSYYPQATFALLQMIAWWPSLFGQLIAMWVASKSTVVFSNVPGPKMPLDFHGAKSRGIIGLIPGLGDLAFGISAISHVDSIYVAIQSDEVFVKEPAILRDAFERNYDAVIKM